MKYTSTRSSAISCTFEEALCSGYAPDGGLFVPESLPPLTKSQLLEWSTLSYPQLSQAFLRLFLSLDEVSDECLQLICTTALSGYEDPLHVVPVKRVGTIYVAELFHGPTFCFKDLGMGIAVHLLSHFCTQRQRHMTLVVSTTGDTGPAAVRAVSDVNNQLLSILVHYPQGQISSFQRKQMTTIHSSQVQVVTFQGGGDDMDLPIKRILTGSKAKTNDASDYGVCGVNSYNIGRPLMQAVHYVWTYLRIMEQLGKQPGDPNIQLDMVVPTGAMGNLAGGYMVKLMGLPLGKLCAVVNVNDITHRAIQRGEFFKSPGMIKTLSDAINIQVPYNFERLLYYLTNGNHDLIREWMTTMDETNRLQLDPQWLQRLQQDFHSERVTDDEMCCTMRKVYDSFRYVADPHTGVALCGAIKLGFLRLESDATVADSTTVNPVALLATASPCKFQETVTVALGQDVWKSFSEQGFPDQALSILNREETEPVVFEAPADLSLCDVQVRWEQRARQLLKELGNKTM